MEPLT